MSNCAGTIASVKKYYGQTLRSTCDLKSSLSSSVCESLRPPPHIKRAITMVHGDVASRYFGCGLAIPFDQLEGVKIVDLGCGSGRDCYVMSQLVGEDGYVTGVDMTKEQLDIARKYLDHHQEKFGFKKSNVKFVEGFVEDLKEIEDSSIDIAISNCVVNLCEDKEAVYKEVFRVLKPGGEFYFSDIYADSDVTEAARNNEVLWGEGMGGALNWRTFHKLTSSVGFQCPRIMTSFPVQMKHPELTTLIGDVKYVSVLYRMFKLDSDVIKTPCNVTYKGTIKNNHDKLKFDLHLTFLANDITTIDGITAATLRTSRFFQHFKFSEPVANGPEPVGWENPFDVMN
ncbi:arsenite methyltransferase-like [Ciona intestinalis]